MFELHTLQLQQQQIAALGEQVQRVSIDIQQLQGASASGFLSGAGVQWQTVDEMTVSETKSRT